MTEAIRGDVLGQKAQAARRAFEARAMSPAKALRRALSRTADVLWDLALVTQGVNQELLDQDGVIDSLRAGELLLLLDGPEGALGLVAIDREVMTGLIEVQTIQQVTQIPVEDRPLTQTDAAMMVPLIDGTLQRLVENLDDHPLRPQLEGYRFGAMVEDSRSASLLLEASSYRLFRVSMDLALGRRKGELQLFFPEREIPEVQPGADGAPGPHEQKMKLLPAQMDAVLSRVTIPLGKARSLKPGDLIPLPAGVLDGVELLAGEGKVVAKGKLGQLNGMRAVRLTWPEVVKAVDQGPAPAGLPDLSDAAAPALPDIGAPEPDFATPDPAPVSVPEKEELPDLPPLDFDGGDFDFDAGNGNDQSEAETVADDAGLDLDGFGGAPIDFDFETDS